MRNYKTQSVTTGKEILANFANSTTRPATVKNDSAVANSEGRKIIKAGTPLGVVGSTRPFQLDPNHSVLTPVTDASVQAVALHDIDITDGGIASDTVILRGDVVFGNADEDVQAMYTDELIKALKYILLV